MYHLVPDYVRDDTTPTMAVMAHFQCRPFILWIGEEVAAQLTEGETYCFVIEDKFLGEIPMKEFEQGYYDVEKEIFPVFKIKSILLPEEDAMGLASPQIMYEAID